MTVVWLSTFEKGDGDDVADVDGGGDDGGGDDDANGGREGVMRCGCLFSPNHRLWRVKVMNAC